MMTVTTLIWLSSPACTSVMRASGHFVGVVNSFFMRTRSPTWSGICSFYHLERACSWWRYSEAQRFQKLSRICWISCHLERCEVAKWVSVSSGAAESGAPIKKYPGVRTLRSVGSLVNAWRGREFRHASIWERSVVISSKVNVVFRPASVRALSRLCAIQKFRGCTSKNSGGCVDTCSYLYHVKRVYSSRVSASKDQYCTEDHS